MKFQPDMISRTKDKHSLKFAIKAVISHLSHFYEAKKGLIYSQITQAYGIVLLSD